MLTFPETSIAVAVSLVVPMGKNPDGRSYITSGFGSTRSVATKSESVTKAPPGAVDTTIRSAGTARAGGVVSTTVTKMLVVLLLPEASVAVAVTRVDPSGKSPDSTS